MMTNDIQATFKSKYLRIPCWFPETGTRFCLTGLRRFCIAKITDKLFQECQIFKITLNFLLKVHKSSVQDCLLFLLWLPTWSQLATTSSCFPIQVHVIIPMTFISQVLQPFIINPYSDLCLPSISKP